MFIIQKEPSKEAKIYLKLLEKQIGEIPPHFKLFATIHLERFKKFINELNYITNHAVIHKDFFTFLRYYIAATHNFTYCIELNSKLLLRSGYSKANLKDTLEKKSLPLQKRLTTLFRKAIKALEYPKDFCKDDLQELYKLNFSESDIYDAIEHGAFLFQSYKIIQAYKEKI